MHPTIDDLHMRNSELQAKVHRANQELETKSSRIQTLEQGNIQSRLSPTKSKHFVPQAPKRVVEDSQPRPLHDLIYAPEPAMDQLQSDDFGSIFPQNNAFPSNDSNEITYEQTNTSTSRTRVVSRGSQDRSEQGSKTRAAPSTRGRVIAEDSQDQIKPISQQINPSATQSNTLATISPARLNAARGGSRHDEHSSQGSSQASSQNKRSASAAEFGNSFPVRPKRHQQGSQLASGLGSTAVQNALSSSTGRSLQGRGRKASATAQTVVSKTKSRKGKKNFLSRRTWADDFTQRS